MSINNFSGKNVRILLYAAQFAAYLSGLIICFLNLPEFTNFKTLHIVEFSNLVGLILLILFFAIFRHRKDARACIIISIICFILAVFVTFVYVSEVEKYTTKWQGENFLVGQPKDINAEAKSQLTAILNTGERPYTVNDLLDINAGNIDDYWPRSILRKIYVKLLLEYTAIFIFFILSLISALQGLKCSKMSYT